MLYPCANTDNDELQSCGAGMFPHLAMINHSCVPNCCAMFRGHTLEIRALVPIPCGTEATICYVDPLAPRAERRAALHKQYFFACHCVRCTAPSPADERTGTAGQDYLLQAAVCGKCATPLYPADIDDCGAQACVPFLSLLTSHA